MSYAFGDIFGILLSELMKPVYLSVTEKPIKLYIFGEHTLRSIQIHMCHS